MKLEVKEQKKREEYASLIINYLKENKRLFSFEESTRICDAAGYFSSGFEMYDYLCLQICDELGIIPDDQNPYKAFVETLNDVFNIENKSVVEIGGGKLLRVSKRITDMQDTGSVTVYDTNSTYKNGDYPKLTVFNRKFMDAVDAVGADVLVGLLARSSAEKLVKSAIEKDKDFMVAVFNKQNQNLFCESDIDPNELNKFIEKTEQDVASSSLGKLKVKRLNEIGEQYPIIYNVRDR